jgi:chromosomal replication initiator protein
MDALIDIEKAVLSILESSFSPTIYELWFKDLRLVDLSESTAVFKINSNFKQKLLQTRHSSSIQRALAEVIGFEAEIKILSSENEDGFSIPVFKEKSEPVPIPEEPKIDTGAAIESHTIVSEYTFDNFIVGDSNKFTHAACMAVALSSSKGKGQTGYNSPYNPLFIYGPSGVGKTHLLFAVTNEIKRNNPNIRLMYKKGEEFTNELISSIQNNTQPAFREKYRTVDVLLIDDIQFIAGKESTQEEFFHTFSALYEEEKQIILTSDRPPRDIKTLEDRLRTRFEWGLLADIQPPSFELRTAIINKKAEALNATISSEVVEYLATKLQNNIRQIEGSIKKIVAISLLTGAPITIELARRAISDVLSGNEPVNVTVDRILAAVSRKYGITIEDIKAKKRSEGIVKARHVSIYLIRQLSDVSFTSIGEFFGRDHTTIMSAFKKVESLVSSSPSMANDISELMAELKG